MMKSSVKYFILLAFCFLPFHSYCQETFGGKVQFDKTVHNFGDIMLSDGPQSCVFTMKNISDKPVAIYSVITSCGCTAVKWTKNPIMPGQTGQISSSYTNDEGPYPFDKSLTVYVSGISKPIILKLRGVSHNRKQSLSELYPVRFGQLGLKQTSLKCGNVETGNVKSEQTNVANLSSSPINVTFSDVSKGLSIKVSPNPIPPGEVAVLQYSVTGMEGIWGKNFYYATPLVNGKKYGEGKVGIFAFTKQNFDDLTAEQKENAPKPMFDSSTYSFGRLKKGAKVKAGFSFVNNGNTPFRILKIDVDAPDAIHSDPPQLSKGQKGSLQIDLDTSGLPSGEALVIVTLTTNSPSRPIINLFITGWLD